MIYTCSISATFGTTSAQSAATTAEGAWVSTKKICCPFIVQSPPPFPPSGSSRIVTPFASKSAKSSSKILCSFIAHTLYILLRIKEVAEGNLVKFLVWLLSAVSRLERSEDKATKLPVSSGAKSLFIIP